MNFTKQYTIGDVTYNYSLLSKKWEYKIKDYTFLCAAKGSAKMRESIAKLVQAGWVRSKGNGIDGLARANINKLLSK